MYAVYVSLCVCVCVWEREREREREHERERETRGPLNMTCCNGWMVSASDSQLKDRGFESGRSNLVHQKLSHVGYRRWQRCLISLKPWVPGDRQRWQLYLDYPWHLEMCKRVYTPQGVEQVMGILPRELHWAGDGCNRSARGNVKRFELSSARKSAIIRTAYYYCYYKQERASKSANETRKRLLVWEPWNPRTRELKTPTIRIHWPVKKNCRFFVSTCS